LDNIIEFPARAPLTEAAEAAEAAEVAEMRASLLTVRSGHDVMQRVALLAERVVDVVNEIDEIADADRQSLLWHMSLIRELAVPRSDRSGITPLCKFPRFDRDPDGAA
jgi:hypothetical protein